MEKSLDLSERSSDSAGARHPWELARASVVRNLLAEYVSARRPGRWLDVGSGDAWLALDLLEDSADKSDLTCWDQFYTDEDLLPLRAKHSDVHFCRAQPAGQFELITMLDVLEHVEDDANFLADVVDRCLAPGGVVVVTVPAYKRLFTRHDEELKHHRRYDPREIRELLTQSGLSVQVEGGMFSSLVPVRALQALFERVRRTPYAATRAGVGRWGGGRLLTHLVVGGLKSDARISRSAARHGVYLPGLSFFAVCSRRGSSC